MSKNSKDKKRDSVRRILLDENSAFQVDELIGRLRQNSCKTDASKVVNEIINIFFKVYIGQEYDNIVKKFFDKRSYLKSLISTVSSEELDASIEEYLNKRQYPKRRGRKSKENKVGQQSSDSTPCA